MGGLVAQLVWRRHPHLVAGLVLCSTSRNVSGGPSEQSAALLMPGLVTAAMWMPGGHAMRADIVGAALLDHDCDPADRAWALSEMRRTSLADALAAMQAVCEFTSHRWIGDVDVPTAVVVTRHESRRPRRPAAQARACPTGMRHRGGGRRPRRVPRRAPSFCRRGRVGLRRRPGRECGGHRRLTAEQMPTALSVGGNDIPSGAGRLNVDARCLPRHRAGRTAAAGTGCHARCTRRRRCAPRTGRTRERDQDAILADQLDAVGGLAVPESYRAVVVREDEQDMFEGLATREKDPRQSLHVEEVPTPGAGAGRGAASR